MRVTNDDQNLITAGKDGTLIVFDIKDKEGCSSDNIDLIIIIFFSKRS